MYYVTIYIFYRFLQENTISLILGSVKIRHEMFIFRWFYHQQEWFQTDVSSLMRKSSWHSPRSSSPTRAPQRPSTPACWRVALHKPCTQHRTKCCSPTFKNGLKIQKELNKYWTNQWVAVRGWRRPHVFIPERDVVLAPLLGLLWRVTRRPICE